MAFHNTNWTAINLPVGTYEIGDLGNNLTASTVHELFCLVDGNVDISAIGGGTFSWSATTGQKINVVIGRCVVNSGEFVGFKTAFQSNYRQQVGI